MIKGKVASYINEDVDSEILDYFEEKKYIQETNELVEIFKNYVDQLIQTK